MTLLPAWWTELAGCAVGCLAGDDPSCVVPSPCEDLAFTCAAGETDLMVLAPGQAPPVLGPDVLASTGDVVLRNDRVVAVLDALDHPHYIAPAGGALLDLATVATPSREGGQDGLRHVFQATGLLPGDAVHYTEMRLLDEGPVKAVQYRGALEGHPDIRVATRYEIRPCDPGIRVRTEVVNLEPDPYSMYLVDALYWGGREHLPFTPGAGFEHPSFGLTTVKEAIRSVPWVAAGAHGADTSSYGVTSCDHAEVDGFHSVEISAVGTTPRILAPRDHEIYERFFTVADGSAASGAVDQLLEVRRRLGDDAPIMVRGRVVTPDGPVGGMVPASVFVSTGAGPVTHAVPGPDGRWSAAVPRGGTVRVDVESYGETVSTVDGLAADGDLDVGELEIPGPGRVTLSVTVDGAPDHALVLVHPADEADEADLGHTLYGNWDTCAPLVGHPWGPSPACNRVLVDGAGTEVALPPGAYDLYATVGPFATIAHTGRLRVDPGTEQSVLLELETLPLQPEGTLSADFHVHGRTSFDSALPDLDRVRSFLAARVDVVASTDHDVVNDYEDAVAELRADRRLQLLVGLETTGHVLFPLDPESIYPKVIGHFNFWPLERDETGPWRGAPWDELAEPGQLFDRVEEAGLPDHGIVQLNHPWGGIQFGRDFAWPTAIGLDLGVPLPRTDDGTAQALFLRTPPGAAHSNADYQAQEVMNGSNNAAFLQYRAIWHYLLSQGVPRAGTANSDSHSLTDNVLGTPRTLVWADTRPGPSFDVVGFDDAVREGRMIGTNGPVLEVTLDDGAGVARAPSLVPFSPGSGPLRIRVTAAPWVPVDEIRVIVDGAVLETLAPERVPADPFGTGDLLRFDGEVDLPALDRDAWIVVEAGARLVENGDLDCDGVPDTGDTDGDGKIDWRDVEELDEDPGDDCLDTVGPLAEPPRPAWGSDAFHFERVTPRGHPMSFTNPLLLDVDGDGEFRP